MSEMYPLKAFLEFVILMPAFVLVHFLACQQSWAVVSY